MTCDKEMSILVKSAIYFLLILLIEIGNLRIIVVNFYDTAIFSC